MSECSCGGDCGQCGGSGSSYSKITVSELQEMRSLIKKIEFSERKPEFDYYLLSEGDQLFIIENMLQTYLSESIRAEDLRKYLNKDKDISVVSLSNNNSYTNVWNSSNNYISSSNDFPYEGKLENKSWFEKILDYFHLV